MKLYHFFIFFIILLGSGSCSYFSISEKDVYKESYNQNAIRNNTSMIMGSIDAAFSQFTSKMILAIPLDKGQPDYSSHVILVKNRNYMLYLPAGKYRLVLLMDDNNDDLFEKKEIAGGYQNLNVISVVEGDVLTQIDIKPLTEKDVLSHVPDSLQLKYDYTSNVYLSGNGQVRKIYDAVFSLQNAQVGYWSPTNFMKSFGANFYMEEPYDPEKIPVIFVHGSNGSPRDWVYFRIRLDKKRYQAIYFYYPSGLRLTLVARILHEQLTAFEQKAGFKKACLVAHSMGGLITQEMLTTYGLENHARYIKLYITLATPWSGFKSADTAVATSPKKLPFWIDIASRSMFIKKLLTKSLPGEIDHYLFFGKADRVSQGRALDERAFKDVKGTFAFQVNHNTILSDRRVYRQYQKLLDQAFASQ
jgi:pimeloyl-ACP methyl ester carboxylesterase